MAGSRTGQNIFLAKALLHLAGPHIEDCRNEEKGEYFTRLDTLGELGCYLKTTSLKVKLSFKAILMADDDDLKQNKKKYSLSNFIQLRCVHGSFCVTVMFFDAEKQRVKAL